MITNVLRVFLSDVFLILRRLFGCKVAFKIISIVSPLASLKTKNGGRICFNSKVGIRSGTEISAMGGEVLIGKNCFINRDCIVASHQRIILEDNVTIGPGTYIYDHDHDGNGGFISEQVIIEENAWIGAGCIILKGVRIGHDSVIAAGSVITKDVPPHLTVIQKRIMR